MGKHRPESMTVELNGMDGGQIATIDKEDWPRLKDYGWYAKKIPKYRDRLHAMAGSKNEYGKWTTVTMHRLIMECPQGMQVDHINGNTLDNRKDNLRICTGSQNRANQKATTKNKHGYMGVYLYRGRYAGKVVCKGKVYSQWGFETAKQAGRWYDKTKLELFGAFASTNGLENWWTTEEKKLAKKLKMTPQELFWDTDDE